MSYKVLGLDPGSLKFGYALVEFEGKKASLVQTGFLDLRSEKDFFVRLGLIQDFFTSFINEFGSSFEVSVESLIHVKNVRSLAKLSQARGAALSVLSSKSCFISEYAPNLIKSSVSGYGHASKESLAKSLGFIFPQHTFSSDDESDALALALCHSLYRGREKSSKKSVTKGRSLKSALKHLDKV